MKSHLDFFHRWTIGSKRGHVVQKEIKIVAGAGDLKQEIGNWNQYH